MRKHETIGEAAEGRRSDAPPVDARSFLDDEFEPRPREAIYVDRSGCLVERRPLPELPPEAEPRQKRYPPPAYLVVLCRCGVPYRMRHGGHSTLGPHPCVPVPPASPMPAPRTRSAPRFEPTVAPSEAPNDEEVPRTPPVRSERKPRLVRSTSNEPAKPTGEPERTAEPDLGWLEA
jgi:hypothetical protein